MSARRRRTGLWRVLLIVGIVGVALGFGAVATNAFGAGDKFERLIAKIDRLIIGTPPPDRVTRPTVDVTPQPSLATPSATRASLPPGATPTPALTPIPRVAVDYVLPVEPTSVFAHELRKDWCAPAGVQMTLATLGLGNTSEDFQREIASRIHEWETYADSHNYEWGPAAMADALAAYGAPGYEIHAFRSRGDAVRDAAIAIKKTGSPVILLAWKGAHTWVMTGYRAEADPTEFPDAVMTGAYILDPWYPWNSSIWGQSDPPGTFQDWPEMERNFLPWKRPEGAYPDRDGKYIIVVPTLPAPATN
jgi:hypothetical protein